MKPKGRRIAIGAAVLALATAAVTAFILRGRIVEEWHIHRLRNGDEEARGQALEWLRWHGQEASLVAIPEFLCKLDPEFFVMGRNVSSGFIYDIRALTAVAEINSRLNPERRTAVMAKMLEGKPRVVVFCARGLVRSGPGVLDDLAIRRLRELLSNPDPIVRSGAAFGLGDAGERARGCVPALEPLKNDSIPDVRQAAHWAIERLGALPGAGDPHRW